VKALERHFAKKNIKQIQAAMESGRIADMAKALDIDLADPEWSDMSFIEASQIMQVRLANKVKRFQELTGGQK